MLIFSWHLGGDSKALRSSEMRLVAPMIPYQLFILVRVHISGATKAVKILDRIPENDPKSVWLVYGVYTGETRDEALHKATTALTESRVLWALHERAHKKVLREGHCRVPAVFPSLERPFSGVRPMTREPKAR